MENDMIEQEDAGMKYQTVPCTTPNTHAEGPGERETRYKAYTERLRCARP